MGKQAIGARHSCTYAWRSTSGPRSMPLTEGGAYLLLLLLLLLLPPRAAQVLCRDPSGAQAAPTPAGCRDSGQCTGGWVGGGSGVKISTGGMAQGTCVRACMHECVHACSCACVCMHACMRACVRAFM